MTFREIVLLRTRLKYDHKLQSQWESSLSQFFESAGVELTAKQMLSAITLATHDELSTGQAHVIFSDLTLSENTDNESSV